MQKHILYGWTPTLLLNDCYKREKNYNLTLKCNHFLSFSNLPYIDHQYSLYIFKSVNHFISLLPRQYDLRESSKRSEVLIDLTEYCGQLVEAKCLAINPRDNNYMAVGANGPFVRLYDIRMIHNHR